MKKLQAKQWLGVLGFVIVLLLICLTFAFVIPLESYSGAQCAGTSAENNSAADVSGCLCNGSNLRLNPAPVKFDYHLLRGEFNAYQDAKPLVDTCFGDKPVKLFL